MSTLLWTPLKNTSATAIGVPVLALFGGTLLAWLIESFTGQDPMIMGGQIWQSL